MDWKMCTKDFIQSTEVSINGEKWKTWGNFVTKCLKIKQIIFSGLFSLQIIFFSVIHHRMDYTDISETLLDSKVK